MTNFRIGKRVDLKNSAIENAATAKGIRAPKTSIDSEFEIVIATFVGCALK